MKNTKAARIRALVAGVVLGTIVASGVAVGRGWEAAIAVEIAILLLVFFLIFGLTRSDNDIAAIYGHRTDERQRLVSLKAKSLSMVVMYAAALVCVSVAIGLKQEYWQADVVVSLGGLSYLAGLRIYGAHDDHPESVSVGMMASTVHTETSTPHGPAGAE
jgi:1,4-dihydroxy-2-naphthoate octaprenyltransferase